MPKKSASQPEPAESESAEPQSAEPQSAEPQSAEPQSAEPQSAESETAESEPTEPEFLNRAARRARGKGTDQPKAVGKLGGSGRRNPVQPRSWANRRSGG